MTKKIKEWEEPKKYRDPDTPESQELLRNLLSRINKSSEEFQSEYEKLKKENRDEI